MPIITHGLPSNFASPPKIALSSAKFLSPARGCQLLKIFLIISLGWGLRGCLATLTFSQGDSFE